MHSSLQGLQQSELIAANLVHRKALVPLGKAPYQKGLIASEVPREHNVDEVRLSWSCLCNWSLRHLKATVVRDADSIAKDYAAIV